jgi:NADPH:quinone reductase-like Zn-dependent oxidoreductase
MWELPTMPFRLLQVEPLNFKGQTTICSNRNKTFLGLTQNGGYAQYVVMNSSGWVPVPEGFSSIEASTVMCTYGTVWHSAITRGRLKVLFLSYLITVSLQKRFLSLELQEE